MTASPPADIAAALRAYFPQDELAALRVTAGPQGFSGANVWKVESSTAAFALRRWPPPGLPIDRLHGLHQLLQHLADAGLPFVSVPIASRTGETLVAVNHRLWQMEPWLPGAADFHANPSEQRLRAAMTALARWHDAAERFRCEDDTSHWFGTAKSESSPAVVERWDRLQRFTSQHGKSLQGTLRRQPESVRRELCFEMLERIRCHRDSVMQLLLSFPLSRERFALQPCLRDIWHDHVLFTGDAVTGLIDPSTCRMDNVAIDLARLLGSLVRDDSNQWQTALDEYRRHHPLSLKEEALVVVLDKSGVLLSALTWLEWLYIERRQFPDAVKVDERLQWLHRRLRNLVC